MGDFTSMTSLRCVFFSSLGYLANEDAEPCYHFQPITAAGESGSRQVFLWNT